MNEYDYRGAFYGHFGHGCVHMRVSFDLESENGIRKYSEFIERAADLVVSHGARSPASMATANHEPRCFPRCLVPS